MVDFSKIDFGDFDEREKAVLKRSLQLMHALSPPGIAELAECTEKIANAITPLGVGNGKDATGGHIDSLTEAVMGITAGLVEISNSISDLAQAIREHESY